MKKIEVIVMDRILRHEKLIVVTVLIITIFFAWQIPDIKINNDIKVFLPDNHISKVINKEIEGIFGGNDRMVVAVRVKNGNLINRANISRIAELTAELEQIKGVDEVTSITNADYIEGTAEGMVVEELVQEIPEDSKDIYELKRKLLSWDLYKDNLYDDEFKATQILVNLKDNLTNKDKDQIYYQIEEITNNYKNDKLEMYIAGASAVNVLMGDKMIQDIKYLIPFIVIVLVFALFLFFRKILPVVLTMVTVIISTIWAIGLMALLGINMTLVSTVIPVLLIAVGSAYGIHILSHYYDHLAREKDTITSEKHREIVLATVKQIGKPVLLAALTTVVGFGSLTTSQIVPIKSFGIFTAIGIAAAFLVALLLIPALLLIKFGKRDKVPADRYQTIEHFETIITKLHGFYIQKRINLLIFAVIVIIISVLGMSRIIIDTPLIEMFKEDTEIRQADDFINDNFAGTSIMNVMIAGEGRGSLTDPEILKQMDGLEQYLMENITEVGKVSSITDFIKRMNRVMHYPEIEAGEQTQTDDNNMESETTSSFFSESSDNVEETTSSFYSASEEDVVESESTSSFYTSEDEGSTDQQNSQNSNEQKDIIINGPDREKTISEYEFVSLLNNSLARADKLGLSGEELIELINRETNYRGAAYNEIPYDLSKYPVEDKQGLRNLISQYLLLYSGNLDDMINDQLEPDKAQMIIQLKDPSNLVAARVKKEILNYCQENFPEGYHVKVSGHADLALAANNLIVHSQTMSILVSFIIVFLIVALSYKSFVAGIYGIIPLGFSLLINFGLMGYTGIKLDVGTAMVASIAIGIGVDYTIHFLAGYHAERKKSSDLGQVTRNTLTSTGKAIIFNAISVAAGFMVLVFSNFYPLVYLGLLITLTMFTSSLAALTILPLLLNIFKPAFISK
ncbi:MAG: uncharacterized protein PWR10_2367 [Halanaerobiales bacterium]|nr:uncharacterized protein [Halanaerobiales bacterium]